MTFILKSYIAQNGERFSLLYSNDVFGFPLFYPTAYIARSVRTIGTPETQMVYLQAIRGICEWKKNNRLDFIERFQKTLFLNANEIDALALHLRKVSFP